MHLVIEIKMFSWDGSSKVKSWHLFTFLPSRTKYYVILNKLLTCS